MATSSVYADVAFGRDLSELNDKVLGKLDPNVKPQVEKDIAEYATKFRNIGVSEAYETAYKKGQQNAAAECWIDIRNVGIASGVMIASLIGLLLYLIWWMWTTSEDIPVDGVVATEFRSGFRGGNFNDRRLNSDALRGIGMGRFGAINDALVQDRIATKYSGRVVTM